MQLRNIFGERGRTGPLTGAVPTLPPLDSPRTAGSPSSCGLPLVVRDRRYYDARANHVCFISVAVHPYRSFSGRQQIVQLESSSLQNDLFCVDWDANRNGPIHVARHDATRVNRPSIPLSWRRARARAERMIDGDSSPNRRALVGWTANDVYVLVSSRRRS